MTAIALPPPLAAGSPWPPEPLAQPSLLRCLLLAAMLHVLLMLWVGTQVGGGGGRAVGASLPGPIQIRLQDGAAAAGGSPALGPATPGIRASAEASGRPDAAMPPAPATGRRATAPEPGPTPLPMAGQAREGAVLRGLDAGLPAAPSLADLQPPPAGVRGPADLARPRPEPPRERPAPDVPDVVAAPQPRAPERLGPPSAPPSPPMTAPEPAREPPDATPARPPALVEAERPVVPRSDEPTQGVVEATRKLPAAPTVAPLATPPVAAPASTAPMAAPPVRATAPAVAQDAPTVRAAPSRPAAAAPAPEPVARAASAAAAPAPEPARAPTALRSLESQTRAIEPSLAAPPPAALPAPPQVRAPPPVLAPPAVVVTPPPAAPVALPSAVVAPVPAAAVAPPPQPAVPSQAAPLVPAAATDVLPRPASPGPSAGRDAPPATRPSPGTSTQGVPLPGGADAALRGIISIPAPPAPPAPPASGPRTGLNLELPRAGAGVAPPTSSSGTVLRLQPPPSTEARSKLARDIEKAGKADCRTAHADKGLIGAAALAADALKKDGGCKW